MSPWYSSGRNACSRVTLDAQEATSGAQLTHTGGSITAHRRMEGPRTQLPCESEDATTEASSLPGQGWSRTMDTGRPQLPRPTRTEAHVTCTLPHARRGARNIKGSCTEAEGRVTLFRTWAMSSFLRSSMASILASAFLRSCRACSSALIATRARHTEGTCEHTNKIKGMLSCTSLVDKGCTPRWIKLDRIEASRSASSTPKSGHPRSNHITHTHTRSCSTLMNKYCAPDTLSEETWSYDPCKQACGYNSARKSQALLPKAKSSLTA